MSSFSLRTSARILSPKILRLTPSAHSVAASSSSASPPQKPSKATKSKKAQSASKEVAKEAAPPVVEKGDTYKAGESFYSYNAYSFYDIDQEMEAHRLPQPSSNKAV